ncbi:3-deoxy-7-phosphoheptulonate synthase [Neonectria punicea]|uniref:Phospho-2-dehydro-3-deoxyheptonate aldolase n=1 Tax=Neonectria punicea TaxID=979145 RepID=A0ABR1GLM2_9HYPO
MTIKPTSTSSPATMPSSEGRPKSRSISNQRPLVYPDLLRFNVPQTRESRSAVLRGRDEAVAIVNGTDVRHRLLVVIGPCSIHDPEAGVTYCELLLGEREKHEGELLILMRCHLEKPRTTMGWKGLVNDPDVDGSFDISKGLRLARQVSVDLTSRGMPIAGELLSTICAQFLADTLSLGVVGARTVECQLHRELASGLDFPVGFKNSTDGSLGAAIDATCTSKHPHHFVSVSGRGVVSAAQTEGNDDCFIILRGGSGGTNYDAARIAEAKEALNQRGRRSRLMIDCSHGNSSKNHKNQLKVAADVATQIASGEPSILGIMIESNINEGNQEVPVGGKANLKYGVSITDACINWEDTVLILETLAQAVKERRRGLRAPNIQL